MKVHLCVFLLICKRVFSLNGLPGGRHGHPRRQCRRTAPSGKAGDGNLVPWARAAVQVPAARRGLGRQDLVAERQDQQSDHGGEDGQRREDLPGVNAPFGAGPGRARGRAFRPPVGRWLLGGPVRAMLSFSRCSPRPCCAGAQLSGWFCSTSAPVTVTSPSPS